MKYNRLLVIGALFASVDAIKVKTEVNVEVNSHN